MTFEIGGNCGELLCKGVISSCLDLGAKAKFFGKGRMQRVDGVRVQRCLASVSMYLILVEELVFDLTKTSTSCGKTDSNTGAMQTMHNQLRFAGDRLLKNTMSGRNRLIGLIVRRAEVLNFLC